MVMETDPKGIRKLLNVLGLILHSHRPNTARYSL